MVHKLKYGQVRDHYRRKPCFSIIRNEVWGQGNSSVAQHFPGKSEVASLIPGTRKEKEERRSEI